MTAVVELFDVRVGQIAPREFGEQIGCNAAHGEGEEKYVELATESIDYRSRPALWRSRAVPINEPPHKTDANKAARDQKSCHNVKRNRRPAEARMPDHRNHQPKQCSNKPHCML